jgi:glycosyltransferase 2 family protein
LRGHFVRIVLALASLALLYHFDLLRFQELAALYDRPGQIAFATILLFLTIPLGAWRWHLLLRCQGFRLPFRKTLEVVLVGQFFSTFLPGAYGGDVVRAGYVYHGARQQAGRLLLSILIDRLSGLIGLVGLAAATQFALPSVIDTRMTVLMIAMLIAVIVAAMLMPAAGRLAARLIRLLSEKVSEKILQFSLQVSNAGRLYAARSDILICSVMISALQFALVLVAFVVIAGAFTFVTAAPSTIAYAGVLSLIANSIPLTPGGIGVGEAVFANAVLLIDPLASGPYATIFLALRALTLLLNLLGGAVFLVYRSEVIEYASEARRHFENPHAPS